MNKTTKNKIKDKPIQQQNKRTTTQQNTNKTAKQQKSKRTQCNKLEVSSTYFNWHPLLDSKNCR